MEKPELHNLIERYFDGETTLEEERLLLHTLLGMRELDEECASALAVMGYARTQTAPRNAENAGAILKKRSWHRYAAGVSVAAVIAVFSIGTVSNLIPNSSSPESECFACIDGDRTNNEEIVRHLIASQFEEVSQASESLDEEVENEFNEICNALNMEIL
ncbi:MAG: hypothetical protein K1V90_09420 [Muribaculaceae bacterium]